jgi:hypothetical protein
LLVTVKPSSTMQNAFAQGWQVSDTEPASSDPSFPSASGICTIPTPVQADHLRRRLAETSSGNESAEKKADIGGEKGTIAFSTS